MKRLIGIVAICALCLGVAGCGIVAPVVPPTAGIYTNITAPLDIDFESSPAVVQSGEASTTTILGLFTWGDAGINAAAAEGGITTIEGADYEYFNFLGLYQRYTTVVHGK